MPSSKVVAEHLRNSDFSNDVLSIAQQIIGGSIPLLGIEIEVGAQPAWRKDYVNGIESQTPYFRRVPYLDATRVGDHKIIWELNRHQYLVLLAMAFLLDGSAVYIDRICLHLETWLDQNPFLRGINWTSALEVAFRALSWIWILAWCGEQIPEELHKRLVTGLYRHGLYLEYNLSVYFSPNTHLLGEAVVLHLLGRLFPDWPRSSQWEKEGARIVEEQMRFQMQEDGVHFEQSTYYHVYALDFFLLHRIYARSVSSDYDSRLKLGVDYLRSMLGTRWAIPLIGDDDGGRLFHPFGKRDQFGRATLATASLVYSKPEWLRDPSDFHEQSVWWLGPARSDSSKAAQLSSQRFASSGMIVMTSGAAHITVDAGPFGWAGAGHSHSDTLSVTVSAGDEELLVDSGTYTYVGDPMWRNWFRGSAAHNTVRIGGLDQAQPRGPFRWLDKPSVAIEEWQSTDEHDSLTAVCRYRGNLHRRRVVFRKRDLLLFIYDDVDAPQDDMIEQFWHFGQEVTQVSSNCWRIGSSALLLTSATDSILSKGGEDGWRSRALGRKEEAPVLRLRRDGKISADTPRFAAVLDLSGRMIATEAVLFAEMAAR